VGSDLFELARIAALPGEEPFDCTGINGGCSCGWLEMLSSLSTIALVFGYVEGIFKPIIEMQAEAEDFAKCADGDHKKAA